MKHQKKINLRSGGGGRGVFSPAGGGGEDRPYVKKQKTFSFFIFTEKNIFFPMIRTAAAPWIVSPPVVSFSAVCSVVLPVVSAFCSSEDFGARRRFFFSSPELLVSACCCCRLPEP